MLKTILENKPLAKQTLILFISQMIGMLLAVAVDVINTRVLGKENFGLFSFINTLVFSVLLFFDFGIFSSGSRLLAFKKNADEEKSLMGTLLILTLFIGLVFSLFFFFISFFVDSVFDTGIGRSLRLLCILLFIFPFQALIPMICRGSNLIKKLAFYNVTPRIFYLLLIISFLYFIPNGFNFTVSFLLFSISVIAGTIIIVFQLRPDLKNFSENIYILKREVKEYGIKIYCGNVFGNISQYFDRLLISYFIDTVSLGIYSIGMRIATPIRLVSNSLSISVFKDFAESERITRHTLKLNIIMLTSSSLLLLIINPIAIPFLFGKDYSDVINLIPILILGMIFGGLAQPYNAFLGAKKKGDYVRNIAIISPLINIILNCIFIPLFGYIGASWALVASLIASYILHLYYYKKTVKESLI